MRQHRFLGQFKHRDGVLATHGREILKEVVERIAFLEIVEERLDRNPRAGEDDGATHHGLGPRDQGFGKGHVHLGRKMATV